jgi:hypothetical protein
MTPSATVIGHGVKGFNVCTADSFGLVLVPSPLFEWKFLLCYYMLEVCSNLLFKILQEIIAKS